MIPKSVTKPNMSGKTPDQAIRSLYEYCIQLEKKLDYALKNIGTENMSTDVADVIIQAVKNSGGLNTTVSNDTFTSAIKQLADSIKLMVTKNGVVNSINVSDEGIRVEGAKIQLDGAVSVNDKTTIDEDGILHCLGAIIGGTLAAVAGTFTLISLGGETFYTRNFQVGAFELGEGWAAGIRWNPGIATEWGMYEDTYGNPNIKAQETLYIAADTSLYLTAPTTYLDNNAYIQGNCSAASFTDRTPSYDGDALLELSRVKSDKNGNIDHSSLPPSARKKIKQTNRDDKNAIEQEGRDLGVMISILTKAVQELTGITTKQQKKIDALEEAAKQGGKSDGNR